MDRRLYQVWVTLQSAQPPFTAEDIEQRLLADARVDDAKAVRIKEPPESCPKCGHAWTWTGKRFFGCDSCGHHEPRAILGGDKDDASRKAGV